MMVVNLRTLARDFDAPIYPSRSRPRTGEILVRPFDAAQVEYKISMYSVPAPEAPMRQQRQH